MTKTVYGIVRGRTIEVNEDLGVAEGQEVEVSVRTLPDRVITENQKAVARLASEPVKAVRPPPGLGKGTIIYMAPDFDAPIDEMKEYME